MGNGTVGSGGSVDRSKEAEALVAKFDNDGVKGLSKVEAARILVEAEKRGISDSQIEIAMAKYPHGIVDIAGWRKAKETLGLQTQLSALGFSLGNKGIDADMGPATRSALQQFQSKHGISPATGKLDDKTKAALAAAVDEKATKLKGQAEARATELRKDPDVAKALKDHPQIAGYSRDELERLTNMRPPQLTPATAKKIAELNSLDKSIKNLSSSDATVKAGGIIRHETLSGIGNIGMNAIVNAEAKNTPPSKWGP